MDSHKNKFNSLYALGRHLAKNGLQQRAATNIFFKLETYARTGRNHLFVADLVRLITAYEGWNSSRSYELQILLESPKEELEKALLKIIGGYYAQLDEVGSNE